MYNGILKHEQNDINIENIDIIPTGITISKDLLYTIDAIIDTINAITDIVGTANLENLSAIS